MILAAVQIARRRVARFRQSRQRLPDEVHLADHLLADHFAIVSHGAIFSTKASGVDGRTLSPASINRTLGLLGHMLNRAVGRESLDRTPFRRGTPLWLSYFHH